VRYPHNLAQQVALEQVGPGVYQVRGLGLCIRVIVVHQLPQREPNAMLLLFGASEEQVRYGREHYRPRSTQTSTLLLRLLRAYEEDPEMANAKLQELVRQTIEDMLRELTPRERLAGLPPEEIVKALPPEERLKGLTTEERLKGLSTEEIVKALPPEMRAILEQHGKTNGGQSPPE
jgi:hypothetical protein